MTLQQREFFLAFKYLKPYITNYCTDVLHPYVSFADPYVQQSTGGYRCEASLKLLLPDAKCLDYLYKETANLPDPLMDENELLKAEVKLLKQQNKNLNKTISSLLLLTSKK